MFNEPTCASIHTILRICACSTDINISRWIPASLSCGCGHKNSCFHPLENILGARFVPAWDFWGAARRGYQPRACLPVPPQVNAFTSSFWVENRSFPTKNSFEGKGALESLRKKAPSEPGWGLRSRGRVPPPRLRAQEPPTSPPWGPGEPPFKTMSIFCH